MSIAIRLAQVMYDKCVNKKEVYSMIGEPPYKSVSLFASIEFVEKIFDSLGVTIDVKYIDKTTGDAYDFSEWDGEVLDLED